MTRLVREDPLWLTNIASIERGVTYTYVKYFF